MDGFLVLVSPFVPLLLSFGVVVFVLVAVYSM